MSTLYSPSIVTDGLVLHLDAANKKSYPGSGDAWNDRSGNDCNFTSVNGPTYSNGAFVFDGSNDYFHSPFSNTNYTDRLHWTVDGSLGTDKFTVEVWVKTSDTTGGSIFSHPWNGNGQYNIRVLSTGGLHLHTGGGAAALSVSDGVVNDGNWHCVTGWADSTTMAVYIDGESYNSQAHGRSGGVGSAGHSTTLRLALMTLYPYGGGWGGNTGHAVEGELAVVRFYHRVLTDNEIFQNYNATKSRFGL